MNHGEKQKIRPLYDSLIDYGKTDYYPYHMPGHKRNGRIKGFSDIFRIDITEIVGKDVQDHGEGVRKVWNDKIRQERVGLSAGALHARDFQAEYFRLPIGEGNKAAFIAAPFAAGSFRTAVRAD